jgi:hypothetical protein
VVLLVVAVAVAAAGLFFLGGLSGWRLPGHGVLDTPATLPESPEEQLCRTFMAVKNAGDPRAAEFLDPAPAVPAAPVSQAEANVLDAEFILHGTYQVLSVRPLRPGASDRGNGLPRFVLVLRGGGVSEKLLIRDGNKVEASQRFVKDPDLIVEVRDGKLHGLEVRLHQD